MKYSVHFTYNKWYHIPRLSTSIPLLRIWEIADGASVASSFALRGSQFNLIGSLCANTINTLQLCMYDDKTYVGG